MQKLAIALTGVNLVLLLLLSARALPVAAQERPAVLRGTGLQIVDAQGRVRASLGVLPASGSAPETVLLRLIDANGQPSVKIEAAGAGAGLSFVGGDDASYVLLRADGARPLLKMVGPNGRQQFVAP